MDIIKLQELFTTLKSGELDKKLTQRQKLVDQMSTLQNDLAALDKEIQGSLPPELRQIGDSSAPKAKSSRRKITIEEVKEAIKAGAKTYRDVAAKLGCSAANVAAKIKAEGKAAGISHIGDRASFQLTLKK